MFNYHDLGHLGVDRGAMNKAVFRALKPGGLYVIAGHSGRPGTGISESGTLHRIEETFLRQEVEAAGIQADRRRQLSCRLRAHVPNGSICSGNARISQGIEPNYVGELVREGVEKDLPYIFTDLEFEPMIEARFAAIKQGFDHIRGRNPKR